MKTNDRELKMAYREHVQNASGTREKDCPTSEDIWRLFSEKTSGNRKARLVDHITTCPFCFREFEAFLEISRAEGKLVREVQSRFQSDAKTAPLPMAWRYAGAFLMAMAILAAAVLSTKWLGFPKRPEERGRLSGQIRLLAPGPETALRSPLVFRWEAVALSEYYVVEVFDDTLLPVWKSAQLAITNCEIPKQIKEKMAKERTFYWMLTAFSPGGTKTESFLEEFRLIDRPAR
jgi:hypothetical protein